MNIGTPTPTQWTRRRRCRDRADIVPRAVSGASKGNAPHLLSAKPMYRRYEQVFDYFSDLLDAGKAMRHKAELEALEAAHKVCVDRRTRLLDVKSHQALSRHRRRHAPTRAINMPSAMPICSYGAYNYARCRPCSRLLDVKSHRAFRQTFRQTFC